MVTGGGDRGGPRVKVKWPVTVNTEKGSMEGVTLDLSTDGAFVSCAKPLRLNAVFNMVITAPDQTIEVQAEVIWSNIYGPNDDITPPGHGCPFPENLWKRSQGHSKGRSGTPEISRNGPRGIRSLSNFNHRSQRGFQKVIAKDLTFCLEVKALA